MADMQATAKPVTDPWAAVPTPGKMEAYEKAMPGTVNRIISIIEERERHEQQLETDAQRIRRLGYLLAFCSIVVLAAVATYYVNKGAPTQGAAIIASGAVAVAGIFVTGRSVSRLHLRQRAADDSLPTPSLDTP